MFQNVVVVVKEEHQISIASTHSRNAKKILKVGKMLKAELADDELIVTHYYKDKENYDTVTYTNMERVKELFTIYKEC